MTVSSTSALSGALFGNGATVDFPFGFKAMSADEVMVLVDGVEVGAIYTVALSETPPSGGTVTFSTAPANGAEIYIVSDPDFRQDIDFVNTGKFLPDSHDEANDRAAIRSIKLKAMVDRLITPEMLPAAERAAKFLGWDVDGNPYAASGSDGGDAALRADLAANTGAGLVAFLQSGAGAAARSIQAKLRDTVAAFDFIPVGLHAAIEAGTDTTDVSSYLQDAIDTGKTVILPPKCLLWIASPLDVPSGGAIVGFGYNSLIKAKANFGDVPLIRNAVRAPASLAARDKGLYFGNFRLDGNKANNATATEFSSGFWLCAVDGAHFDSVWVQNPKGDGLTALYAIDGVTTHYDIGCSNITGFIRTEDCARQGVAPVCAEGCDLSVYDTGAALFSLDPETDNAANYVRNNHFRLVSIGAGNGTVASGGVGVGGQVGDVSNNTIDFVVFNSAGSGVVWRNTDRLTLRGIVDGTALSGLVGIDLGTIPSLVNFDVDLKDITGIGFFVNETAGAVYNGSIRIEGAAAGGSTITNAAGGRLHLSIEGHTGQGLILTNTTNMTFPDLFVGAGSSHSVWVKGASNGNRFPNLRTGASTFGWGLLEEDTSNDNRATNARITAGGAGTVSLIGATSLVEIEPLKGSATWDPGSIADGDSAQTTFAVAGAAVGDLVEGSFSLALGGLALSFEVSAANTVRATLLNNTGGAVDLASGTVKALAKRIY